MCVWVCVGGGRGREQGVLCVRERVKVLVQKKKKKARETLISWKLNLSRNNRQITRF